jgi:cytochrome P450
LSVSWSLIELDKYPECLAKLMAEINSVDTTDFTNVNSKMPYLDAVIMEISRLYPTVHATLRVINRETKLASSKKPVVLKPGMLIYLSYLHLHTSPKFWGPDAGEFVPERFLGGYKKDQPFMSFGYGPRNCVSLPGPPNERKEANIIRLDTNLPFLQLKCIL